MEIRERMDGGGCETLTAGKVERRLGCSTSDFNAETHPLRFFNLDF